MFKKYSAGRLLFCIIPAVLLVLLDQYTKQLAVIKLKGKEPFVLINNVLELRYIENTGAAFGVMEGMRLFFVLLTVIVTVVIFIILLGFPQKKKLNPLGFCFVAIAAGAVGNFIDRLINGYVVDFIYFKPIDFPVFNVADIYVTCSAFLLGFLLIFRYKEQELAGIPFLGPKSTDEQT